MRRKNIYVTIAALLFSVCLNAQKDSSSAVETKVYTLVEQNPEFQGGDMELIKFLQQNITYPQMERDNDIQGKVTVRFIVDVDGSVIDPEIVTGASPGLNKEALRIVKLLPKFKPGMQLGKAVKVYFTLPVVFRLEGDVPKKKKKNKN